MRSNHCEPFCGEPGGVVATAAKPEAEMTPELILTVVPSIITPPSTLVDAVGST